MPERRVNAVGPAASPLLIHQRARPSPLSGTGTAVSIIVGRSGGAASDDWLRCSGRSAGKAGGRRLAGQALAMWSSLGRGCQDGVQACLAGSRACSAGMSPSARPAWLVGLAACVAGDSPAAVPVRRHGAACSSLASCHVSGVAHWRYPFAACGALAIAARVLRSSVFELVDQRLYDRLCVSACVRVFGLVAHGFKLSVHS